MANFADEIAPLLASEGGLSTNKSDRGGVTKFGISKRSYPNLDIPNLTKEDAIHIYKRDYWDKIGGDELHPATAAVAFDAAVNHGVGTAKKLLRNTRGDPLAMINTRERIYDRLSHDPTQKQFKEGWMNRLANLKSRLGTMLNPIGTAEARETPWQEPDVKALHDEFAQWKSAGKGQQPQFDIKALHDEFAQWKASQPKEKRLGQDIAQGITDLGGGVLKGASNIGNTLRSGLEFMGGQNTFGKVSDERRQQATEGLQSMGVNPESLLYQGGKIGAEIAGTAGTGGLLSKGLTKAPALAEAVQTGGLSGGNLLSRTAGGALQGAASTAIVNPEDALSGGAIGAVLPGGSVLASKAGNLLGKGLGKLASGGDVIPQATKEAAGKAISQGYVVPPSQVKPTLANRLIEGTAGKITTAQNASARNQGISNTLAAKAIGASDLSEGSITAVRKSANAHYDAVAKVGKLESDDTFRAAIDQASARTAKFAEDFPGLKNKDVDDLVESLKTKGSFNSDTAIEAIKRLREDASANKISLDAAKKELGRVQGKIAGSLEDLVDRNLTKMGKPELLGNYRAARQTLAKTYSVEKATDKATGNLNANKLAAELQKGKPLSGELRDIAEFAQAFPKAAQNIAKMGSLPGTSPLDVGGVGLLSGITGNPGFLALMALRPAARKAALSNYVQKGLVKQNAIKKRGGVLARLAKTGYRATPVLLSGQK